MKRTYKIPIGNNYSDKQLMISMYDTMKNYGKTITWDGKPLILNTRTHYIKLENLKNKKGSFYELTDLKHKVFYSLVINIKLFERLQKICKITNIENKELIFVNDLLKHEVSSNDYFHSVLINVTGVPKEYFNIIDYQSRLIDKPATEKNTEIFNKLSKMMTKLRKDKKCKIVIH